MGHGDGGGVTNRHDNTQHTPGLISPWPTLPERGGGVSFLIRWQEIWDRAGTGGMEMAPVLTYLAVLTLLSSGYPRPRLSPGVSHSRLLTDGLPGS